MDDDCPSDDASSSSSAKTDNFLSVVDPCFPLKNRRTYKRSRKLKDLKITISCRCISWSGLLRGCGVSLRLPAPIVAFFLRSTGGGGGLLVVEDARVGLDEAPPVVDSDDSCEISAIETAEGSTLHASCQLTVTM